MIAGTYYNDEVMYIPLPANTDCAEGDMLDHTDNSNYHYCIDSSRIGKFQTYPLYFTDSNIFEGRFGGNCNAAKIVPGMPADTPGPVNIGGIDYYGQASGFGGGNNADIAFNTSVCPPNFDNNPYDEIDEFLIHNDINKIIKEDTSGGGVGADDGFIKLP